MGSFIRLVTGVLLGLVIATASASADDAQTAVSLNLRDGPGAGYARIAVVPAGALVDVRGCQGGWCGLIWNGYRGYAVQRGLLLASAYVLEPEVWPIFPAYPYRAGHYPKADWYFDMPPYTAISPSFYRRRFFMMAQERNRYRYMPHIFRGSGAYSDGGPIEDVNLQAISSGVDLDE
ncbi:MAG: SH3 domain-containing protein [Methyloceanibacter sp.]|jgi:hypothetical protein|uniref:SH3 domain-containing protein n=1 Tax=Methyloceanibacter sp. TaxID=1965321 RepID=UPI0035635FC1